MTKKSHPVKIWERFNTTGAIIYSGEFIGSLFKLSQCDPYKNFVLMLCSVFAWINCPLYLFISSAKIAQSVKQWVRKQKTNMHSYRCTGSNPTELLCFATHIIFNSCTAVKLTVSSWLIIMEIQHRFLKHKLTVR